ncbi:MAG: TRAP transporter small permease [Emcibacter sp.]|nr:TRAP transporter small permease [Emcibacter sp.]
MNRARAFIDLLYRLEKAVALFAFAVMTLVIIADVVSRKLMGHGIAGAPRVAVYAMIITALISFGLASHKGRHLRPHFADNWLPEKWDSMIIRLQEGLMAVFCLIFAIAAIIVVYDTYLLQETSRMLRIVLWPMQSVMPLAFLIGAIRHGIYACYPDLRPEEGTLS